VGTYRAWIADTTGTPVTSFSDVGGSMEYVLVTGQTVASSWADLTDKSLVVPIDRDEYGVQVVNVPVENANVWTGTNWDGTVLLLHCLNWTTDSVSQNGYWGSATAVNPAWTTAANWDCDSQYRLYCFEQ
jgi:hypothetical protein